MLLIFPSLEISRQRCIQIVRGEPGSEQIYSIDPVKMAILWRGENAKTLHVVDKDGFLEGTSELRLIVGDMVKAVDIPIQVGGGLRSIDAIRSLFQLGVYRVVVGTAAFEDPAFAGALLKEFGSRKIAIAIESCENRVVIDGRKTITDITPLDHARIMLRYGVSRIVFYSIDPDTKEEVFDYKALKELAQKSMIRITLGGGIASFRDLISIQELEKFGVDSTIIGAPLYENKFPCQHLWRRNEKELKDLGPTRRI